ncbi:MAG: COQ9 family protein [Rhodobacteraceae bacterium]|nr:COQ9 family protein [Paracoccaceae bacterium]
MTRTKANPHDHATRARQRRDALVMAMLAHVPFDGWGKGALERAAADIGIPPGEAVVLFPDGARDAIAHFVDMADRMMIDDLAAHGLGGLKLREKVALAVRMRLERWTPHREAIRRALAVMPMRVGPAASAASLYRTVDAIWRAVGDQSVDFNFYTKRALLAAVYGSTLMFWLNDRSEDCAATWAFLVRRIDDVMQVPKLRAKVTDRLGRLPNPLSLARRVRDRFGVRPVS